MTASRALVARPDALKTGRGLRAEDVDLIPGLAGGRIPDRSDFPRMRDSDRTGDAVPPL